MQTSSQPSRSEAQIAALLGEVPKIMARYRIPPKFINMDFQIPVSLAARIPKSGAACFTGNPGVGKTMNACLFVRDHILDQIKAGATYGQLTSPGQVRFISFPEFIMEVQDSFRDREGQSAFNLLREIANYKLLIIDDLGAEKVTDYVRQATYYIVNHREMFQLPTLITTNFSMDLLDKNIDPRISSRISGMCEVLRFDGEDRRKQERKKA